MTSRTVAIHEVPCRGCTSMEHPTSWAGKFTGRSQAEPQSPPGILAGCEPGRDPGGQVLSLSGGPPAASVAGKSRSRASSRTWRARAETLRCRSGRRAAKHRKASAGRRTWKAGLRGKAFLIPVLPVSPQRQNRMAHSLAAAQPQPSCKHPVSTAILPAGSCGSFAGHSFRETAGLNGNHPSLERDWGFRRTGSGRAMSCRGGG